MMQRIIFTLILFICINGEKDLFAQKKETINWLTFSQLSDSMESSPKKIFIEIYTDWCGPCKLMEKKVFPKRMVVRPMNDNYYAVRLNAEKEDSLTFNDSTYYVKPYKTTRINQLVAQIGLEAGHLSYPTIIILNEKYEVIYRQAGTLSAELLNEVLETWK